MTMGQWFSGNVACKVVKYLQVRLMSCHTPLRPLFRKRDADWNRVGLLINPTEEGIRLKNVGVYGDSVPCILMGKKSKSKFTSQPSPPCFFLFPFSFPFSSSSSS